MQKPEVTKVGGWRGLLSRAGRALALTWRAGPWSASLYLILTLAQGLIPAGVTLLTKWLLDGIQFAQVPAGEKPAGTFDPIMLVAGIGVLGILVAALPYATTYVQSRLKRGVTLVVQDRLFGAVNGFDGMARFENPAFLDRLRMAQQAATMAPEQTTASIFGIAQSMLTVMSFLGVLLVISPLITLITVVAAIPALFVQLRISRQQADMMWTFSPRSRRQLFYQMLMLDLAAVKEIRLFGLGDFLLGRMRRETVAINAAEERLDRKVMVSQGPLAGLGAVVAAGGLVWMVFRTLEGQFTIGDISAFIAAVAGVQAAIAGVVAGATQGYESLLLFGHYVDVSDMKSDLPAAAPSRPLPPLSAEIRLEDVWFRYTDDSPWVLKGVSVTIPFGGSLALVGLNGAGKSTLVKLLCRLYDPTKGRILWDGVDLRDVAVDDLRDRISAVFQDYMSYDLSAAENIGIGDLANMDDRDRVVRAAERADVHEFVSELGRGYDTMLSRIFFQGEDNDDPEQGVTLSGGQWQRIALARAMMRVGRDLLILDEPSAGLDAAAEQAVHDRLREYRKGATSVLISHRMGAVRHADRIVVLQEGVITEEGDHASLMRAGGEYARLFSIQAANYVEEAE
ncbi:ATP-binding cassette subfamily B protein [Stackebrandtia albiflava]|uniref:ATP-binding cassette subfamily B protein n=1 Tax=Stackebrandtia albiflava TaxID=406432 RepID=A0A562UQV4_9ACTN|nr:ABC transporter ATP-binding protein [Stackebrandtia albiflava]TWJ07987.1 ATP-binding cassette subfamily B protein [Stackebrandtia albiflava]